MHKPPGLFIAFEGIDGTGKSTQAELLKQYLESEGHSVVKTREPGGSPGAEAIRELLVTGDRDRWDGITELLLFSAARRNHVETVIKPALAEGKIVICDRFIGSTMAYQGSGHGLDSNAISEATNLAVGNFRPHLTLFLTIGIEEGLLRATTRKGKELRFESMDIHFYRRVHDAYMEMAKLPQQLRGVGAIDTAQYTHETTDMCIERVAEEVKGYVKSLIAIHTTHRHLL